MLLQSVPSDSHSCGQNYSVYSPVKPGLGKGFATQECGIFSLSPTVLVIPACFNLLCAINSQRGRKFQALKV